VNLLAGAAMPGSAGRGSGGASAPRVAVGAALVLGLALGVAACGGAAEEEPAPAPSPTLDAGPRTLVAADLDLDALGALVEGPQGAEVESEVAGLGTVVSYVACPAQEFDAADAAGAVGEDEPGDEACDIEALPQGARFTYVHRVTLAEADGEAGEEQASNATAFRTAEAAPGFANVIGFSREQAVQALGDRGDIKVQLENGQLIWRIAAGDGWAPGETLTFFWQSTQPPAGPEEAYLLEAEGESGAATGPFPAEDAVEEVPAAG